jgi:hypothetical protein
VPNPLGWPPSGKIGTAFCAKYGSFLGYSERAAALNMRQNRRFQQVQENSPRGIRSNQKYSPHHRNGIGLLTGRVVATMSYYYGLNSSNAE